MDKVTVYMATRNYYDKIAPAIRSMQHYTKPDRVYLLAEDDDIPFDLPGVTVVNVSEQTIFTEHDPNWSGHRFTFMVLMRAALPKLLPQEDVVLSIDADTLCLRDASALWDLPLDGYFFAAAKEPVTSANKGRLYTNVGVTLMNLKLLRETGKADEIITALKTNRYILPEQDCMNERCAGGILELPPEYNSCDFTEPHRNAAILHFAYRPEWYKLPCVRDWML